MKNKILLTVASAVLICSMPTSQAASKWWGFNNGATGGWTKQSGGWTSNGLYHSWQTGRVVSRGYGIDLTAATNGNPNNKQSYGGALICNTSMNGGLISARIKYAYSDQNVWGGFWTWNDKKGNNTNLEIDVVEKVRPGGSNGGILTNYYWGYSGVATGWKLSTVYNGFHHPTGWLNGWALYKATWAHGGKTVKFYRNNTLVTDTNWKGPKGQARWNPNVKMRFTNRAWGFSGNPHLTSGSWKNYANLQVDSAYMQY